MENHTGRFVQFSDGVFAIAITLLALELKVPHLVSHRIGKSIQEILPLMPTVFAFILSFITIAIFWVNHQELTKSLHKMKKRILWGNVGFLLFISLIPFGASVVGENTFFPLAVITFAGVLFGASLLFSLLRYWVHIDRTPDRISVRRSFIGPVCYLFAIVSAFIFVPLSYVFISIPPIFYFFPRPATLLEDNGQVPQNLA